MAVGECLTYARGFFRLAYPAEWTVRENRLVGITDFSPPADTASAYAAGIALVTIPETGTPLEELLRPGIFLLTRDLANLSVEHLGQQREGALEWYHLLVRGRSAVLPGEAPHLHVTKHVALCRPGPGVLTLALHGPTERIEVLEETFTAMRRSVQISQ